MGEISCDQVFNPFFFVFQVAEKVRIDNLQEAELQALLDEVVSYRGKKDGTELFQVRIHSCTQSHLVLN